MPGLPILRTYVPHCSIFGRFASMRLPTYVRTHLCTYVRKAYVRTYVRMYCFAYVRTYVMDCGADPVSLTYVRTIPSRRPRWRRVSPTMPSRGKQQLGATVQVATSAANAARASLMPCSALKHDAVPHHSVQAMVRHGVAWEEWPAPAAAASGQSSAPTSSSSSSSSSSFLLPPAFSLLFFLRLLRRPPPSAVFFVWARK